MIRPARSEDADVLARLAQERDGGPLDVIRERFAAEIAREGGAQGLLVVADAGAEAGVVAYARASRFVRPADSPANAAPEGYYLSGIVVSPAWRRRGIAAALTQARLAWIGERAPEAYYFANARNEASIALHATFGFVEVTRDFWHPSGRFEGGVGVLFRAPMGDTAPQDTAPRTTAP